MFKLEKRLTSFFRKNTDKKADCKKWTLHKTYDTLDDTQQAYDTMIAKSGQGLNWRIIAGDTVIKQKNS